MTMHSGHGTHNPQAEVTKACKPLHRGWLQARKGLHSPGKSRTATTACAGGSALHNPASVAPPARHIGVVSEPEKVEHDPWFQCCHGPTADTVLPVLLRHEDKACVPASAQVNKNPQAAIKQQLQQGA